MQRHESLIYDNVKKLAVKLSDAYARIHMKPESLEAYNAIEEGSMRCWNLYNGYYKDGKKHDYKFIDFKFNKPATSHSIQTSDINWIAYCTSDGTNADIRVVDDVLAVIFLITTEIRLNPFQWLTFIMMSALSVM